MAARRSEPDGLPASDSSHLTGIFAHVSEQGSLLHVDWRIHTIGPRRACLYCLGAQYRSDAVLDRDGRLDDPDYIQGLSHDERERYARRNVFAFSLSVASHEVLQLIGLITGQQRVGGIGPQHYQAYPGEMEIEGPAHCRDDCDVWPLVASAHPLLDFPDEPPAPLAADEFRLPFASRIVDRFRRRWP